MPYVTFDSIASGIILSHNLYVNFVERLYIASNGTVNCNQFEQTKCSLPNSCAAYVDNLFADFSFRFAANGATTTVTVPLATFAVDGTDNCTIWV